jgi:hypothetical protein
MRADLSPHAGRGESKRCGLSIPSFTSRNTGSPAFAAVNISPTSSPRNGCGYGALMLCGRFNFQTATDDSVVDRHCEPTGRANAHPMTGSAKQSISPRQGTMDCFVASAPRNDVDGQESAFSRLDPPEVCISFRALKSEGAGNAGCALHPRSRVQMGKGKHTSIQVQRRTSDIPCAMV